jgi:transposase
MLSKENDREGMKFAPDAMRAIVNARWEGNVRELRNVVESLVVLTPVTEIRLGDLPDELKGFANGEVIPDDQEGAAVAAPPSSATGSLTMEEIERRAILDALDRTGGNRTQAAETLGIGLRTLQRKLKEYKLAGSAEPAELRRQYFPQVAGLRTMLPEVRRLVSFECSPQRTCAWHGNCPSLWTADTLDIIGTVLVCRRRPSVLDHRKPSTGG